MHVPFSKYRHYSTTKQYLPMNHYRSPVKCDTNPISECPVTHPPRFQGVTTLLASSFLHCIRELYLDIISGIDLSILNTSHYTFCEYFTLHILWILHATHSVNTSHYTFCQRWAQGTSSSCSRCYEGADYTTIHNTRHQSSISRLCRHEELK